MVKAFTICDYESRIATSICIKSFDLEERALENDQNRGDQRWSAVEVEVGTEKVGRDQRLGCETIKCLGGSLFSDF